MKGYTISREYWFAAAHMLPGHPKCGRLHGHNYKVVVLVKASSVGGDYGWVMDFADLDAAVKPVIELLDHQFITTHAAEKGHLLSAEGAKWLQVGHEINLPIKASTAENLAWWIGTQLVQEGLPLQEVQIWETYKSMASWTP